MDARRVTTGRLTAAGTVKFTAAVALLAIFFDAALGHGLTWENDPYWTYWVTKTFLIATVFGLGTAWFGIGAGRGAAITAVHTLVLTVYYWTLSPIGLPSSPEWLDLEHTWVTGVPIHFIVIYLGYLATLWLWRRRQIAAADRPLDPVALGTSALLVGVAIVVLSGAAASLALGDFPGVTWFLVRLLITVPFLMAWWVTAGRDTIAAVSGAVTLALVWATYSHFLGPVGLPDSPLRILNDQTPPATVRWLDYTELWLISLPVYIVTMAIVLLADAALFRRGGAWRRPAAATAVLAATLFTTGATVNPQDYGQRFSVSASGEVLVETGEFYTGDLATGTGFTSGTGDITVEGRDMGARVTPLPPHDELLIEATIEAGGTSYEVTVDEPLVSDPLGRFTTWWGVGINVDHHGHTGIGTPPGLVPEVHSEVAAFGLGELSVDGSAVATGVPVHVMTMEDGSFELDVGDPDAGAIPGVPAGHLRAVWPTSEGVVSSSPHAARYIGGGLFTLLLLGAALILVRRARDDVRTDRT